MKPEWVYSWPASNLTGLFNYLRLLLPVILILFTQFHSNTLCVELNCGLSTSPAIIDYPSSWGIQSFLCTAAPARFPSLLHPGPAPCSQLSIRSMTEYNCPYREWNDAGSNGGDSKSELLEIVLYKPRFSMIAGWKTNLYKYDYLNSHYNASINADMSSSDLFFGFVRNFRFCNIGGMAATDLKKVHPPSGLKGLNQLRYLRLTSAFDYTLFCSAFLKPFHLQTTLTNSSVIAGTIQIKNQSNNNSRFIDIDVNKDSLNVRGNCEFNDLSIQCDLITEIFPADISQEDSRLLISINGSGYGCNTGVRFKTLQYTPSVKFGINQKELSFRALEGSGESFSELNDLSSTTINAMVSLIFSRNTGTSVFFENIQCSGGDVFFEVYPFTSWGVVFDIPDRYKVSDIAMTLHNAGVKIHYNKIFFVSHALTIEGAVSYAEINGHYTSKELVRYMGLLPVYQNEEVHQLKKRYLTVYPELMYTFNSNNFKTFLKLRQFIPVEMKKEHSVSNEKPESSNQNYKKKVFGGFSGVLGLEFYTK